MLSTNRYFVNEQERARASHSRSYRWLHIPRPRPKHLLQILSFLLCSTYDRNVRTSSSAHFLSSAFECSCFVVEMARKEKRVLLPLQLDNRYRKSPSREKPAIFHEKSTVENERMGIIRKASDRRSLSRLNS